MKASELIAALQVSMAAHGDLDVYMESQLYPDEDAVSKAYDVNHIPAWGAYRLDTDELDYTAQLKNRVDAFRKEQQTACSHPVDARHEFGSVHPDSLIRGCSLCGFHQVIRVEDDSSETIVKTL